MEGVTSSPFDLNIRDSSLHTSELKPKSLTVKKVHTKRLWPFLIRCDAVA
jgi:hypothetical protein